MRKLSFFFAAIAHTAIAASLCGQGPLVTVRGTAFDSLHNVPLAGAFITVSGTNRSAVSDARGAFQLDSLASGTLTLVMQHDALDSLGMPSVSRRVNVASGAGVVIAVPSFASMWRQACDGPAPRDSALIFGIVSDAGGTRRVRDAAVEVSWYDYAVDSKNKVTQHQRLGRVRSDSTGAYTLCGVPGSMAVRVQATTSTGRSAAIDLLPGAWRVMRRDLRIAEGADSLRRGTIVGAITSTAAPLAGARVMAAGMPETRTGPDGRFIIRDVPIGTRQVEITAIGLSPAVFTVDVTAGDTAYVTRDIGKLVELPGVKVSAPTVRQRLVAQYLDRKRAGLGKYRDSTDLEHYSGFGSVVREIPSAQVRIQGTHFTMLNLRGPHGACAANIIIDGVQVALDELDWIDVHELAAVEIYPDGTSTPMEITSKLKRTPSAYTCGAVVLWTKRAFVP
jgi:hypothetical protein